MFTKLYIPDVKLDLRKKNDQVYVWDIIRKKELILTPEEWVRQHVLHYFIDFAGTPKGLIALEKSLLFKNKKRRFDLVIYGKDGLPKLLVECKSPDVKLSDDTIQQIAHYNHLLNVNFLLITNGLDHRMFFLNSENNQIELIDNIPHFNDFGK
jgi:hypothetical protein